MGIVRLMALRLLSSKTVYATRCSRLSRLCQCGFRYDFFKGSSGDAFEAIGSAIEQLGLQSRDVWSVVAGQ